MIINKGVITKVPVTVTEQTTLSAPVYYLFEFESKQTREKSYCIGVNISTITGRIDFFNIEETDTPDPLNSEVSLMVGEYRYKIYQQSSTTNLNPLNTTVAASGFAWVECGVMVVPGESETINEYDGAVTTNKVYEG